ncbi:MAG: hypothetical protein ACLVJO_12870 [[Clostridium] scindens]
MEYDGTRYTFSEIRLWDAGWGRGVWTYDNRWYWGQATPRSREAFRVQYRYGFGDTSAASENMLFYDGVVINWMISPSIPER